LASSASASDCQGFKHYGADQLSDITPEICHERARGNPKDGQAHLRHAAIGTTMNIYTQAIPESVQRLVNAVADDVMTSEKPTNERVQ
jgi:hypothetical protein